MRRVILIRHAETDLAGTFCGHTDPPVNEAGRKQLPRLIESLRHHAIKAVYSSDLQRATFTAQALADAFVTPLSTYADLREIHFGRWEGLRWAEIEARTPDHARQWLASYPRLPAPDGETYESFRTRVLHMMHPLLQNDIAEDSGTIAIMTHAGVLQLLLTTYGGLTPQEAWHACKPYCSFFALDWPRA